jgi:cytochrome c556
MTDASLLMRPEIENTKIMNHNKLVITSLLSLVVAALAMGCKPAEEKSAAETGEAMAKQYDKVKQETKQATRDMKDYAYGQKTEFVESMQKQLTEINRDLDQLSAKVEKSSDAAKAEAQPKLQALREQAARLNKQLDEAKNATESTWDSVRGGSQKAYNELKDGFKVARQWVSDKIAP